MLRSFFLSWCLKAFALLCLLLCCINIVKAQFFTIDGNRSHASMPFLFTRGLVIVKLKINNRGPFNFILDTGVGQMLITDPTLVDSIDIKSKRTIKISGFGEGEDFEAFITGQIMVSMGNIRSNNISAAILKRDLLGISNYAGMHVHGLLGYEFFNQLTVKIDFLDSTITVTPPGKFAGLKGGSKLPLTIENNRPYLTTSVTCDDGTQKTNKFIVDLGAGHAVSLENITDRGLFSQKFIPGNLGVGLKGPISGYLGRVKSVDLGRYKIKNIIASFPEDSATRNMSTFRNGNLGMDMLKKFEIVFDYADSALYIKSTSRINEPFEHDMSGLQYYASGDGYSHIIIDKVEPGSPGELAGLERDDEITAINFKPVSTMTLEQIDEIFRSKDNRVLFIEIYHNQKFTTLMTLKRRI